MARRLLAPKVNRPLQESLNGLREALRVERRYLAEAEAAVEQHRRNISNLETMLRDAGVSSRTLKAPGDLKATDLRRFVVRYISGLPGQRAEVSDLRRAALFEFGVYETNALKSRFYRILRDMVRRGVLTRVKRGVYALP